MAQPAAVHGAVRPVRRRQLAHVHEELRRHDEARPLGPRGFAHEVAVQQRAVNHLDVG